MCNCAGLKLVINIMKKTNLKYFKIDIKIESNVDHSEPADLIYFSVEEMGPFWSTRFYTAASPILLFTIQSD